MKETIIKVNKLCKSFNLNNMELEIIKDLNLEIYKGDFTVIMGSSGSGKSTLLYNISTMDKPTSGNIELAGKDITNMSQKNLTKIRSRYISFVFQSINLLNDLTAFENISYCGYLANKNKKEVNQKSMELLEKFGLITERNKYPSELSGGQQQRIAIARALINKADILFCDEPTGALNSSTGQSVLNILSQINEQGQSIVMVTHDLNAAMRATRLIFLKDGKIDGEMSLNNFMEADKEERKENILTFLKDHEW